MNTHAWSSAVTAVFNCLAVAAANDGSSTGTARDVAINWWWRTITLRDYNTRVVLCGTVLLGIAAGLTGVYLLLRKRALLGDAIAHSTLPGVAIVFWWSITAGVPKSQPLLLLGAAISGALGGLLVLGLRHWLRIREDASLGIVLSVMFGAGVSLVGIVQNRGSASGLDSYIYGKAASMTIDDAWLNGGLALAVLAIIAFFAKEFKILCFDIELARSQGWPVLALDLLLVSLVVTVTIIGLQAVGLILVIALLIVPAAAARFWSHNLSTILAISAVIGGISSGVGTLLSASFEKLPGGATIVLVACGFFAISFLYGRERGCVWQALRGWRLRRQQEQQHLLRSMYELLEARGQLEDLQSNRASPSLATESVAAERGWTSIITRHVAKQLERIGLMTVRPDGQLQLTPRGLVIARRLVREHRLLERYFLDQTAVSEGDADRGADYLEHALAPETLWELNSHFPDSDVESLPASPHPLRSAAAAKKDEKGKG